MEYILWRDLIQKKVGLHLKENKQDFLQKRLWERMSQLSVRTYAEYYDLITTDDDKQREWEKLVELLVNCQSSFFRHIPAFDALMDTVLPELANRRLQKGDQVLSMWSAGCSRGQEAYSLAMAFVHVFGCRKDLRVHVTGTDISFNALERAQKGEYFLSELRDMHPTFRDRYMTRVDGNNDLQLVNPGAHGALLNNRVRYRVNENIRTCVQFALMNLSDPTGYWIPLQDVIFCQNVLLYFSVQNRADTVLRLLNHLKPGGYLFPASGEALGLKVNGATTVRFKDTLAYRRNEEAVNVQIIQ